MNFFDKLSAEHQEILVDSISQIALLIAGADGEIDQQETEWAEKITKIRSYAGPEELLHFYSVVGEDFNKRFFDLVYELPEDVKARTEALSAKLSRVNEVLSILEPRVAYDLYSGFLSFAKHVAKSSGGFLRMFSISSEEAKLIDLKMIHPIDEPEGIEEEE